ncbi:GNAT family N-acetyltransferase [Paraburkholderia caribensis]|uniref:GNAT family N-acetyltransferase n=1 Tax=Paraburkholderia caribensis TaxID=75105 RepID=UPI001CB30424|nr:GNAT family N-acetyltransferase [Paraburkholderia caribensis]CAG9243307.1 Acetyltransferase (GNAT) domain-containing protein [Paraburkholderia caribensis]
MRNFLDNLGLETDLLLHAETGVIESRDDYIVVRTPDAPEYFFGNMLVLPQCPSAKDLNRLEHDFAQLVGSPPLIAHRAFIWSESAYGAVTLDAFVEQGYEATVCRVLAANPEDICPVATNSRVVVRAFSVQQDWDDWSCMQLADMPNPTDVTSQRYIAHRQAAYRSLIDRGLGAWWGAFIDDEQVGSLGLFVLDGVGRFQSVITGSQHRNRNVCKTLVREVTRQIVGRANRLVIVADEAYHAGRIYEMMGFQQQGRVASLCQDPRNMSAR